MTDSQYAVARFPGCFVGSATERRPHLSFNMNISVFGVVRRSASLTLSNQLRNKPGSQSSRSVLHIGRSLQLVASTADAEPSQPQGAESQQSSEGADSLETSSSSDSYDAPEARPTTQHTTQASPKQRLATPDGNTAAGGSTGTSTSKSRGSTPAAAHPGSDTRTRTSSGSSAASAAPPTTPTSITKAASVAADASTGRSSGIKSSTAASGGSGESSSGVKSSTAASGGSGESSSRSKSEARAEAEEKQEEGEEVASSSEEREMVAMQGRCWCAACHKDIPWTAAQAGGGGIQTCAGCHRCYHTACVHKQRLGTGWRSALPGFLQQLPLFAAKPWYHCDMCQQISDNFASFAANGEVEMPGIREAMLDAETEEEVPYYTLQLFQPCRKPDLPTDPAFRKLVGVLRRHAPLYVPLVTPQDCMDFDYGLLVLRDTKPVAAAMFDVYGEVVGSTPLYGARDPEARECLMELWAEMARDCGLLRVGVQVPADDYQQKLMLMQDHGFGEMGGEVLGALSKEIPAFAEELQVGTSYLGRDLFTSPEILKTPEDLRDKMVQLALNEEVVEKVGRNDDARMRPRD